MIGIITGSGLYDLELEEKKEEKINTPYGEVPVIQGKLEGKEVVFISRHRQGHKLLPNMINHRGNIATFKQLEVEAIISTTVCGILNPEIPLAKVLVFDDLYFPDNRLPSGEICSMYTKEDDPQRGHYIFGTPFSSSLREAVKKNHPDHAEGVYVHANGPRFNSATEIKNFKQFGDAISQTAGPEVVLAGESEIPLVLIGFGVDYANQVKEEPTPTEVLVKNLKKSNAIFTELIKKTVKELDKPSFEGFVYRFQ